MERKYCAFIYIEKGKKVGITFPDFPGCIAVGKTVDEALLSAKEALEFHIEGMIEENMDIPFPRSIDDIIDEARTDENNPQIAWLNIEVPERKAQRINITIPELELKKIDNYISNHKKLKNRSNFLTEAALNYIEKHA